MAAGWVTRAGTLGTVAALIAGLGVAVAGRAAADVPTPFSLSGYHLIGRYSLPDPSNTTPPDSTSLLANEASSVTYDWDTDTLFVVGDGGTSVVQVSKTGTLIDSETLAPGNSPQGTTFFDTEAITYVGNGQFVLGEERDQQVNLFTYQAGHTLTRADVQTVKLGATIGNIGIEGFAYDPASSTDSEPGFIGVKEMQPKGIFQTNVDFAAGTATNANPSGEPTNLFDPTLVPTDDFSDVYPLSEQPSLAGTSDFDDLIIDSQQSGELVETDRSGNVLSSMDIVDPGAPISVPQETHEGVTMDRDGTIYMVNENGGGDASHPQLWVYSATVPAPRVAVTEVAPWGSSASYGADWFELSNTGTSDIDLTGWTMDDSSDDVATSVPLHGVTTLPAGKSAIFLEDTGSDGSSSDPSLDAGLEAAFSQAWFGSTTPPDGLLLGFYGGDGVGLSTSGDAVNLFDGNGSFATGVSFGAATSDVTFDNSARLTSITGPVPINQLAVDGIDGAFTAADGVEIGSPDGLAPAGSGPPSSTTAIQVTEVAPWASGNSPYAADWFELSNTGTSDVDLSGWAMDDNSDSATAAVALRGVSVLPAGKSAVFIEDTDAVTANPSETQAQVDADLETAFAQAWFSTDALPAGDIMGFYGGSGVGLSTGGDHVNIFDSTGARVTGIAFGAAPSSAPFASFDNSAGAGSTGTPLPTVSTLSALGANGAFAAADGAEVGSPFVDVPSESSPPPPPAPSVIVSEVAPWGSGDAPYAADWFELTNTGTSDVNLTGWSMDDSSDSASSAVPLTGVSSLPAGKSAVFIEDTGASGDAPDPSLDPTLTSGFAQAWFGTSSLPAGDLLGFYGGDGVGLSTGGDAVNIFDGSGDPVTGVSFGAAPSAAPFATFDNTAGNPAVSTLSAVGTDGAFAGTGDPNEIGSPFAFGNAAPPFVPATVAITEVDPSGSGMSYGADWFELTNTGKSAVDLTGWSMDDSSDSASSAVPLTGVSSLPAGASALFAEDDTGTTASNAALTTALAQAWFGTPSLPSGFLLGFYGGSGVGLSTSGGAVNLFDGSGNPETGVSFGAADTGTPTATFDNAAGDATVTRLSVAGTNGAFASADGAEIGSPGTIATAAPAPASTSVTLAVSATSVTQGQSVTLSAKLTPAAAAGSVTFRDATKTLGSSPVTGGTATLAVKLGAGTHSLTAVFTPTDATAFAGSTSAAVTVTVNALGAPAADPARPGIFLARHAALQPGTVLALQRIRWTPAGRITIQWLRDGRPIVGATRSSYVIQVADIGHVLSVTETDTVAGRPAGHVSATVGRKVVAGPGPRLGRPVRISGVGRAGSTLRITGGAFTGPAGVHLVVRRQWLRDGAAIRGATGTSYRLTVADAGKRISVRETAVAPRPYAPASATSNTISVARIVTRTRLALSGPERRRLTIIVAGAGLTGANAPTGIVEFSMRSRHSGAGGATRLRPVQHGRISFRLPPLPVGRTVITVRYLGDGAATPSRARMTITIAVRGIPGRTHPSGADGRVDL